MAQLVVAGKFVSKREDHHSDTNTDQEQADKVTIIKRADADAVLQRVALLSFLYYPEVQLHEPDYSLSDDIEFCLEPVGKLDEAQREELHQLFGQAIINPSEYREEVFAVLDGLVTEGSDEK